jgi:hypothetical protein
MCSTIGDEMSKERRALCRFEPCDLTTATLNDSKPEPAYGILSNISELGISLVTESRFAPGRDVQILVCLNRSSVLVQADARVVWTRTDRRLMGGSAECFLIGAKFLWMPIPDRRCLKWALSSSEFKKEPTLEAASSLDSQRKVPNGAQTQPYVPVPRPGMPSKAVPERRRAPVRRRPSFSWADESRTYDGVVIIVREGISSHERLCRIVRSAGFNAVLTNSPETVASKVRVLKPSLVLLSEHIGGPGISRTVRRIKDLSEDFDTPVALLAEDDSRPYLSENHYPVDACFTLRADAGTLVKNIRLLARRRRPQPEEKPLGALEGNIERNMLSEVLQYLSTTGKTGCMTIRAGHRSGSVYLDSGFLVHAHFGPFIGVQACHAIVCLLQEGYFKFEPDVRPRKSTMRENGVELILQVAKEMDELTRRRHHPA